MRTRTYFHRKRCSTSHDVESESDRDNYGDGIDRYFIVKSKKGKIFIY